MPKIDILFSASVSLIILHSYTSYISAVIILPVYFCAHFVFRFCDHCYTNGLRLRYLLGFSFLLVLLYGLISISNYNITFFAWIYNDLSYMDYFLYFFALFIACNFVITSIVFYFTVVVYRSLFLFVLLLIPFGLNFTRRIGVPAVYAVVAIGLYFTLLITLGKKELRDSFIQVKKKYIYAFAVAVCLIASLSFLIDLPENERRSIFDDGAGLPALSGLLGRNYSSGVPDASQDNDEILFMVEADEQLYFIRQIFINYDGRFWVYDFENELNAGIAEWEILAESMNFDRLFKLALEADDAKWVREPLEHLEIIERLTSVEQIKTATIIPQRNQTATYVLAPARTFSVPGLPHNQNRLGEIFISDRVRANPSYRITYYRDFFRENHDFQILAQQSMNDVESLLSELSFYSMQNYGSTGEYLRSVTSFGSALHDAMVYKEHTPDSHSLRLFDLAMEITGDMSSDYERAAAIERYFLGNGFKYDADGDFVETNMDILHFVFESQSGTCGHYATAMTLMARSIGLNARYVEGFTSTEINEEGLYVIRAKHSHAFVQVHIPLYGWVTFDPTVPREEESDNSSEMVTALSFIIFLGFSVLILLGIAGYMLYTRVITELLFRHKAAKSSGRAGIIMIYGRVIKLARKELGMVNVSSVGLRQIIYDKYGMDISTISNYFERAFYGNENVSLKEKDETLEIYKRLYSCMRKKENVLDMTKKMG